MTLPIDAVLPDIRAALARAPNLVLQAAPGSSHGYDVVNHAVVNVELGGSAGHARFSDLLGAAGLG